ncbi:hypothetical protein LUZ62_042851 [Rhynchospora pubera]|uniref:RNase H type-1 domain-containing protein n=1 Tax=Rhynchospora pubera TaxID=906938 RepID=A0AAV8FHI8_9POAL|nr:hypothetical protein LUZ62_042851 [Rhynchospora pubera]
MGTLDEEGNRLFANTLWEIWKERNKAVIEHCPFKPMAVIQRVTAAVACPTMEVPKVSQRMETEKYEYNHDGWQVIVDASWDQSMKAGGAYVVYERGTVHSVGLHFYTAQDSFQAEAVALEQALIYVYNKLELSENAAVNFFSDCSNLVLAVSQGDSNDVPSWRAMNLVNELINHMEMRQNGASIRFVRREAVHQAHNLANIARRQQLQYQGSPHIALQQQGKITRQIDENFFQRVQEAPP